MLAMGTPNIGPRERRSRLLFGALALAVAVAFGIALVVTGAPRPWRLVLFLPLSAAAFGFFQAWGRT
jgi:fatty acid desaturase